MRFHKLVDLINFLTRSAVVISFVAIIVFSTAQIIFRYLVKNPLIGTEELANFFQVWLVFIGTSIAIHDNSHIRVEILYKSIKPSKIKLADTIIYLTVLIYSLIILFYGCRLVIVSHVIKSPALRWPLSIVFSALPISALFSCIYLVQKMVLAIKSFLKERDIIEKQ